MDIQGRLTAFALVAAGWAAWILAGLSAGGVAVALDRAIHLIRTSARTRAGVRARKTPILIALQSS
jgi:hypothetical protein